MKDLGQYVSDREKHPISDGTGPYRNQKHKLKSKAVKIAMDKARPRTLKK